MHAVRELLRHTDVDVVGLGRNDGAQVGEAGGVTLRQEEHKSPPAPQMLGHRWDRGRDARGAKGQVKAQEPHYIWE